MGTTLLQVANSTTLFFHDQGDGRCFFRRVEAPSNTRNCTIFKSRIVTQGSFGCQKQKRFGALTSTSFCAGWFVHALWGGEFEEKPTCSSRVPRVILVVFLQLFDMFGTLSCLGY